VKKVPSPLSRRINRLSWSSYYYLEAHQCLIISYLGDFLWETTENHKKDNSVNHDVKGTSFLRWKNRSKDCSSNSSSSKALLPSQFTANWPPYSARQITHSIKSKSGVAVSRREIFPAKTKSGQSSPSHFAEGPLRFPSRVSVRNCRHYCAELGLIQIYCQIDP
jgi:hypothetical protein